ncbi:MAG: alpha/beta fold hydrolase [Clostridiales Family XIII bacterium]|nr:alpha/beta fold hydrolase [Clostridiales Family XIII bacterium]
MKLFCIPHAGGSAVSYRKLSAHLDEGIQLVPVELAGRGARIREPLYDSLHAAALDAYHVILRELDGEPYVILGHSMGSWIAAEVLGCLAAGGDPLPCRVLLSGNYPPHLGNVGEVLSPLSDEDFMCALERYGDIPPEVFQKKPLRDLFLPVLRSDFRMLEAYGDEPRQPVKYPCDIAILCGAGEAMDREKILSWGHYASGKCEFFEFEGTHMFLLENAEAVCGAINRLLIC